jgi:hypothetical protein
MLDESALAEQATGGLFGLTTSCLPVLNIDIVPVWWISEWV